MNGNGAPAIAPTAPTAPLAVNGNGSNGNGGRPRVEGEREEVSSKGGKQGARSSV